MYEINSWMFVFCFLGYCCRRWNDIIMFFEVGCWYNGGDIVGDVVLLFIDFEYYFSWKEFYYYFFNFCGFYEKFFK